jgi:S1-C subfamily serine protease
MAVKGLNRPLCWLAALVVAALAAAESVAQPTAFPGHFVPHWSRQNRTPDGAALPAPSLEPDGGGYTATRSGVVTLSFTSTGGATWQGTGFLIGSKGVVVTNYHLIEGATEGQASLGTQSRSIDGVMGYDKSEDLALLKMNVEGLEFGALGLAAAAAPAVKTAVTAVGGPERFADATNEGEISAAESGEEVKKRSPELSGVASLTATSSWLVVSSPVTAGNSGGPLVGPEGTVVGVQTWSRATWGRLNRAAPVSALRRLIAGAEIEASPLKTIAAREGAVKPSADAPLAGEIESSWLGSRHYSRSEMSEAISRAGKAAQCSHCGGKGTVTVTHLVPHRLSGADEIPETLICPECHGTGLKWGDTTGVILAGMVQRVMLSDRKVLSAGDYGRMATAGLEAFRPAALDRLPDGGKANETLAKALGNLRSVRGSPVVFYGAVGSAMPYGGGGLYTVRTFAGEQAIIVHGVGLALSEGRSYLVGGMWAGKVTIPVSGGAACGPGVEVLWAEPLH